MIKTVRGKLEKLNVSETLRYLGYAKTVVPEEQVENLVLSCADEVLKAQDLRACYSVFDISAEGEKLNLGFAEVESHSLSLNLAGCGKIVLFACTAGAGIDRLLAKYKRISPAKTAVIQAAGAALAEDWCEELCALFKREYGDTKPRFSCGYGDLPLTLQRDIFAALSVTKQIGVTLSDDCFMTPTKSVTAIVGIKNQGKTYDGN
ncbi:MAG: Vitamin B12 dependent methionine synthase activation subunit [Clostridia bacterium]|nr:Vitamin B12 dependent methionine synthase activation subunit [Clostridia bacterium]